MVTKAKIVEMIDNYHAKVRIPIYHKQSGVAGSTPDSVLPIAVICAQKGASVNYLRNDLVWVDFENDEKELPVIIGIVYNENSRYS